MDYIIDKEFQALIPPLTSAEFQQFKNRSLLKGAETGLSFDREMVPDLLADCAVSRGSNISEKMGKDFDAQTFFRRNPQRSFPCRLLVNRDFGNPEFETAPDMPDFVRGELI